MNATPAVMAGSETATTASQLKVGDHMRYRESWMRVARVVHVSDNLVGLTPGDVLLWLAPLASVLGDDTAMSCVHKGHDYAVTVRKVCAS